MQSVIKATTFLKPHHRTTVTSPESTYTKLIERYGRHQSLRRGNILHAHLIITGLARLTHVASKLISFYVECKQISNARKLFDKFPKSNIRRWLALAGAYSRCGFYQDALNLFSEMQNQSLRPNKFVIPSVLKACGHLLDVQTGRVLHSVILKCLMEFDVFVISSLIDMYSRCGFVEKAQRVFDGMMEKDLVALNALVSGYAQYGLVKEGFVLVEQMRTLGVKPDVLTWNALIAGFARKGDKGMVSKLFELMSSNGVEPDVVSWTSVISGLVQNFHNEAAFDTFKQMLRHGFYPTSATISSLLPACANVVNLTRGKEIHGYALMIGVGDDIYVRSALVDMYCKCGFISEATELFYKMPDKNTVTWNSMIFGFANHGYCQEAIELFNQMEKVEGKKLNHLTFTAVLTACSHAGMVELGQSLFLLMQQKYNIVPRLEHYACMADLLGRAGKLAEAYDMIKMMPVKPDLFVWGALLGACRNHGDIYLAEIAAGHLAELEPGNVGNNMLLSNLYADAGSWQNVAKFKEKMKRKKLRNFPGCSWIGDA